MCLSVRESYSSTVVVNITPLALMQFILPCCSSIRSTLWFKLIWHMVVCILRVLTDASESCKMANLYSQHSLFASLSTKLSRIKTLFCNNYCVPALIQMSPFILSGSWWEFVCWRKISPMQICWASKVLQLLLDGRGKSDDEGLMMPGPVPHRMRVNWLSTPETEERDRVSGGMKMWTRMSM